MNSLRDSLSGRRIAGIDFGTKRIGIAVCDELHISVKPVKTIQNIKNSLLNEISNLFASERVTAAVIGMPVTYSGNTNNIQKKIELFGEKLKNTFEIDVFYIDESFSSIEATDFMVKYGLKKKVRSTKGMVDQYAAVVILQQFLSELEAVC